MNYKRIYDQLISTRQKLHREKNQGEYFESHHIVPKCMGGTDDKENLILLTAREHFVAHWLLALAYKGNFLLLAAWNAFCRDSTANGTYSNGQRMVSRNYEICRKMWISELHKRKETHKEWWDNWRFNSKGTKWFNNGVENIRIKIEEADTYLLNGYVQGRITFKRSKHSDEHKEKLKSRWQERLAEGYTNPRKGKTLQNEKQKEGHRKMVETRIKNGSYRKKIKHDTAN